MSDELKDMNELQDVIVSHIDEKFIDIGQIKAGQRILEERFNILLMFLKEQGKDLGGFNQDDLILMSKINSLYQNIINDILRNIDSLELKETLLGLSYWEEIEKAQETLIERKRKRDLLNQEEKKK
jgi:chemotaxis protein histidine kinase CheA